MKLPNGHTLSIEGVGTCVLSPTLTLHNIYFIPHFRFNLLCVFQLTNILSCLVSFSSKIFFLPRPTLNEADWSE